jgi:hypothetical protein
VKTRILFVFICLAASTMVACHASIGIVRTGVFQTQAAQALAPSERAVMEQPDKGLLFGDCVDLEDVDSTSNDKWYKVYPGFVKPARIEVAPGNHRFFYMGGDSYRECFFRLVMLSGHVYKPTNLGGRFGNRTCRSFACTLEVKDTAPNGERVTITVSCGGGE